MYAPRSAVAKNAIQRAAKSVGELGRIEPANRRRPSSSIRYNLMVLCRISLGPSGYSEDYASEMRDQTATISSRCNDSCGPQTRVYATHETRSRSGAGVQ